MNYQFNFLKWILTKIIKVADSATAEYVPS